MPAFAIFMASLLVNPSYASDARPGAKPAEVKSAASARTVAIEASPSWVRDRKIPDATEPRLKMAQNGIGYLLVDEQYRTQKDGHDYWFRSANKVTNRSGLESAGLISLMYNPSIETVGVNFVRIIRDGKVIDLTRDTEFRVVEREEDLNDGIVSGTLKVMANIRDLRVGDVVDYATTVHTRGTLWPGNAFYHFSQRYSDPVAMRTLRLLWSAEMAPQYKAINSDVSFRQNRTAEGVEWEWIATDPPALLAENDVPVTAFLWGRVDVSTMKDWGELARWATKLYQGDETLPDDFEARLASVAKASANPGERLTAAMRYIQDNIRYVGEEMGEGSYVPRRPRTVLARAYGDCKDKTLLLVVALRRLGIDAVPALVSTRAGERLPDRLPSPLEFDHVIVRAVIDGKVLWIDPTGAHRGGRGAAIVPSDLGYALPLRMEQTALERMEGYGERAGRMTVVEKFYVDEGGDVPLTLDVETRFTDARADNVRANWAANPAKSISDGNLKFYRERFPGLMESKPLDLRDDRDANVLTMIESYTMPRDAFNKAGTLSKFITRAYSLQNVLPNRQANPRLQPLALSDHVTNEQTIELRVKDRMLGGMEDIDAKGGPIAFSRKTTIVPDGIVMTYRLDTGSKNVVPPGEAEAIYALSDQIKKGVGIEFYLDKMARRASAPRNIDAATWAAIKPEVEKVSGLMQKNDEPSRLEALSLLSEVSGKVPHPSPAAGMIEGMKAGILSDLRRPQAALAALRSATEQYDGNPEVFRLWIAYELDLGTPASVAKAMRRTRETSPKVIATLDRNWVELAMQKARGLPPEQREAAREDICIELSKGGWQQDPPTAFGDNMVGCAAAAESRRGNIAEARAALTKGVPVDSLLTMAMDRRHEALWPELDKLGSDGFRKRLEQESARAAVAAKAAPKDYRAASYQMQTLRALGRFQEALAIGKPLTADKAQIEIVGSDAFWMVNEYASNLRALGRMDEAIAVMDGVLALGEDRYPELTSLAINRTEMVTAAGRFQASLDSLNEIEDKHFGNLSAYGKMWVWANKACTLNALGHADDAKAMIVKLTAKPEDNWSAVTTAAVCRNDTKAIADQLISRLRGSDTRSTALGLFIAFGAPQAHTPFEKGMRQAMDKARALPEVQAELRKFGRAVRYAGTAQGWSEF